MNSPDLAPLAKVLANFARNISLYAAPGLSVGGLLALINPWLGLGDIATAFALGFFVPIGPVYLVYASGWGMRRTLAQIKDWETAGLIDTAQAKKLRDGAVAWFVARRFGK
jgi:hypothetical protein